MEPIITSGAMLVGAGAWFADKIFSPSAILLGDSLKLYVTERVRKIFLRAEEIADETESFQELPPAFMLKFLQDSSISDDDEIITDMWANLLLNSSKDIKSRNSFYISIISRIGAPEAHALQKYFLDAHFEDCTIPALDGRQNSEIGLSPWGVSTERRDYIDLFLDWAENKLVEFEKSCEIEDVMDYDISFRGVAWGIRSIRVAGVVIEHAKCESEYVAGLDGDPYEDFYIKDRSRGQILSVNADILESAVSFDILVALGILNRNTFQRKIRTSKFETSILWPTPLGIEFMSACSGVILNESDNEK